MSLQLLFFFFPITNSSSASIITKHMCWRLLNRLLSLWTGNGLLKTVYTAMQHWHPLLSPSAFVCVVCFCFPSLQVNVASSSATLYDLMINMYDMQEPYVTLILCKVYSLCLFWCFFSTLCQEIETNRDAIRFCRYVLFSLSFLLLFLKGTNRSDNSEWNWHRDCTFFFFCLF